MKKLTEDQLRAKNRSQESMLSALRMDLRRAHQIAEAAIKALEECTCGKKDEAGRAHGAVVGGEVAAEASAEA